MVGLQEATEHSAGRGAARPPRRHVAAPALRDRVLGVCLAAIPATGVALFGAVEPDHALPLEAAALLVGAWAVVTRARRGERPLPLPRLTLPVLLLAALPAAQLLPLPGGLPALLAPGLQRFGLASVRTITVDQQATVLALLRWLSYAAFLIAALEILPRRGAAAAALTAVATLGVLEAVYGIGNLLAGNEYILWVPRDTFAGDATGTLVNRNHYAALFELCLPALLARRWLGAGRRDADELGRTAFAVGAAGAMGLAVLLSHSRAGTVALAAGLAIGAGLASRAGQGPGPRRIAIAVVALSLAYGSWVGLRPLTERFAALPADSIELRGALWRDAIDVAADFPLAGVGAGGFEAVFPAYRRRLDDQSSWAHAHQDTLELVIETGISGLALALLAALGFGRRLRTVLTGAGPGERAAAATLAGGIAAMLLHAQVDFPLHIPGIVYLLLLIAAATVSLPAQAVASQRSSASSVNRRPPWSRRPERCSPTSAPTAAGLT